MINVFKKTVTHVFCNLPHGVSFFVALRPLSKPDRPVCIEFRDHCINTHFTLVFLETVFYTTKITT